ncbi:MAG: hypothetical protein WKG03_00355 [Telluria sp.]
MKKPYPEAKAIQEAASAECQIAGAALAAIEGVAPGSLVPIEVRMSPEYNRAKQEFDCAFKHMEEISQWFTKEYEAEYEADLLEKIAAKMARR